MWKKKERKGRGEDPREDQPKRPGTIGDHNSTAKKTKIILSDPRPIRLRGTGARGRIEGGGGHRGRCRSFKGDLPF